MGEGKLFEPSTLESWGEERPRLAKTRRGEARVNRPQRDQIEWTQVDAETLIPEDHVARAIWSYLERMELSAFYESVKSVAGGPGRPATDPQVLLALWMLATVDGVGSARRLARLCEEHNGYRWLRWNVPVNYHMLSDFRVANQSGLDDLLTQVVATLMSVGTVSLRRVAQDGMRVRAGAGSASFRGRKGLKRSLKEARKQVKRLAQEREHPDPEATNRERAARERAAREREERVREALELLPMAQEKKERQRRTKSKAQREKVTRARTSTTDPQARVMKMPDGGFRPAYNVELATDGDHGVIVGVGVTTAGTDAGQAAPMEEQVEERTGRRPHSYLMDGGFATREDITILEHRGVRVYAPVRLPRNRPEEERYLPRYGDGEEVVRWRRRMATQEAKTIYRSRCAIAEWANAQARMHGVSQFNVRGLAKVTSVMLLVAVAHNFLRWRALVA